MALPNLRRDCALIDAVLTTAFDWKELANFLSLPAQALPARHSPCVRARHVLRTGHARLHESPRFATRLGRHLERRFASLLGPWRELPLETRRYAARRARRGDFEERGLDPAAFLWALASDPDPAVRAAWRGFARRSFPFLERRLS